MGNWQLEVGKFAIYMMFPVASFYAYHQVDWFEDSYKEIQKKVNTKESIQNQKEIQEFITTLKDHRTQERESKFQDKLEKLREEQKNAQSQ